MKTPDEKLERYKTLKTMGLSGIRMSRTQCKEVLRLKKDLVKLGLVKLTGREKMRKEVSIQIDYELSEVSSIDPELVKTITVYADAYLSRDTYGEDADGNRGVNVVEVDDLIITIIEDEETGENINEKAFERDFPKDFDKIVSLLNDEALEEAWTTEELFQETFLTRPNF